MTKFAITDKMHCQGQGILSILMGVVGTKMLFFALRGKYRVSGDGLSTLLKIRLKKFVFIHLTLDP
jgi:hypothetical protein